MKEPGSEDVYKRQAYHFSELRQPEGVWVGLTELLAILSGVFMLRGQNWARWLALAWIAFHVIPVSYTHLDVYKRQVST